MPETMPRALGGMDSSANEAPTPQTPPMAKPNRARKVSSTASVGAKAELSSSTE